MNNTTPAREAAQLALDQIQECLKTNKNFILEAGAGAGKTYSLIETLEFLIKNKGLELLRQNKRIACITFTNVAKDQIDTRTDKHPVVVTETIHAFCWSLIKQFQLELKTKLSQVGDWKKRLLEEENPDLANREIIYENGYKRITDSSISIHHDDVIWLMVELMENPKFRLFFVARYPILLVDEYQDTSSDFIDALTKHLFDPKNDFLIGFFGDHWQKIYGDGCGKIAHSSLTVINKESNFRSAPQIVDVLNQIRPKLKQEIEFPDSEGIALAFHTNNWVGKRRTERHWKGDLPSNVAHDYMEKLKETLEQDYEWDLSPDSTKILMLTHKVLASEQGYEELASKYKYNDQFVKKEDPFIQFIGDTIEPICEAFLERKYGVMFNTLSRRVPQVKTLSDKSRWTDFMNELISLREQKSIGEIMGFLQQHDLIAFPTSVARIINEIGENPEPTEDEPSKTKQYRAIKDVPYRQVIEMIKFINGHTPFATKHSVKGDEFENVIVVVGRGWNQYDFGQMMDWVQMGVPSGKEKINERSRNLFYVTCSRPKKKLAVLFTQELSNNALRTLEGWFSGNTFAI